MTIRVLRGHCLDVLAGLPPQSVHAVVTSPPYFRARRYGCPPQVWPDPGGQEVCAEGEHEWVDATVRDSRHDDSTGIGEKQATNRGSFGERHLAPGDVCRRCAAWRGELGWEPTVGRYVAHLVQVFRAARRVLRDDGSLWVNIAGGYANEAGGQNGSTGGVSDKAVSANRQAGRTDKTGGLPPLNWIDVPGLLGAAMQADGWVWRSYVHLVKRSPLPESVQGWRWERCRIKSANAPVPHNAETNDRTPHTGHGSVYALRVAQWADCPGCPKCSANDGLVLRRGAWRPTRATEALLLFVKGAKYWSDSEAVRVPGATSAAEWLTKSAAQTNGTAKGQRGGIWHPHTTSRPFENGPNPAGRNAWDWMEWPVSQFAGAHFASFSPDLAAWCLKAGVPERCCPVCGAGYARVIERGERVATSERGNHAYHLTKLDPSGLSAATQKAADGMMPGRAYETRTVSWRPTCACKDAGPPIPGTVLDPFSGAGSTLLAADRLGRHGTGVDLNGDYTSLSVARIRGDAPLLAEVALE